MSVEQKIESFVINDNAVELENQELKEIVDRISNQIVNMYNQSQPIHPLYELQFYNDFLKK